jgi:hypothetical protein
MRTSPTSRQISQSSQSHYYLVTLYGKYTRSQTFENSRQPHQQDTSFKSPPPVLTL